MLRIVRALALAVPILATAPFWADAAHAQYREFTGKIDKINDKKMIVDNRMGDKLSFDKTAETTVEGIEGNDKPSWEALKKDQWVVVYWKMMDKPRKAYRVKVQPPPEEEGEDL